MFLRRNNITALASLLCLGTLVILFFRWLSPSELGQLSRSHKTPSARALKGNHITSYKMNSLMASKDALENREKVLILTPMAKYYPEYLKNVQELTYPHELIELGFIFPATSAGDAALKALDHDLKKYQREAPQSDRFARVVMLRQDTDSLDSQAEKDRHEMAAQKRRRSLMSLARNSLLFTTLGPDISWVLWLDADVVETPHTLIQDMTQRDRAVLVANCYQRYYNADKKAQDIRPYDYNSWQDSDHAKKLAESMDEDDILLEGYADMATYRTLMAHLYDAKGDIFKEIPLDGVGGTALMVKSDVHRDGAMFPPFPFYHLIETEGFAKMAQRLGYRAWGMPNYLVYHYNE